ncbi:MAG: succinate dehydrogenase assembly factor 2 [Casimicrobiaceae bacterium]|nr:succinate dehydrogenase assembly factor 2 [Casimicrobiaceae bacterium]MCX8099267.1 succinate dehydrogenase assembly factor 2 [Casimicrobiaceae bacterium]MDW8312804.1 succinate dehydrogenase assembly factor 2 [Burkholderiales bacterium]
MLTEVEFNRLRWRARRGLLENDLVLERFLTRRGCSLTADENAQLQKLLELDDITLWDLISGRLDECPDGTAEMVRQLRAALQQP